jgi:hypothetical protein
MQQPSSNQKNNRNNFQVNTHAVNNTDDMEGENSNRDDEQNNEDDNQYCIQYVNQAAFVNNNEATDDSDDE